MTKEMSTYEEIGKSLGEIYLERARYLLSTDELLEEMLDQTQVQITNNVKVEFIEQEQFIEESWLMVS